VILNLLYVLLALSVVVSLFGMVNTLALTVRSLSDWGVRLSIPVGTLVVFTVVAIVVGVIAAVIPARRASRLDVLTALHYE
jgi:putative ABC transport system permease protein